VKIFTLKESIMTTTTQYGNNIAPATETKSFFGAIIDVLLAVKLREQLDADTGGDKSDAAYSWGL
jgi:hypothetical protein